MLAHATLAGRALDVDVLVHALDVADGGVEAGGDRVDLHRDGVQTAIQSRETLTRPVLVVSGEVCQVCVCALFSHRGVGTSVHNVGPRHQNIWIHL